LNLDRSEIEIKTNDERESENFQDFSTDMQEKDQRVNKLIVDENKVAEDDEKSKPNDESINLTQIPPLADESLIRIESHALSASMDQVRHDMIYDFSKL
jgi:hypothetical protein